MKKRINYLIAIFAAAVLLVGIIANICTYISNNPKQYTVSATSGYNYAKDGRQMVTYTVLEDETDRYVMSTRAENINQVEYYRRLAKNKKILANIARRNYEADMTDANETAYNTALASHKAAKAQLTTVKTANLVRALTSLCGTYLPLIALAGVGMLVNQLAWGRKGE